MALWSLALGATLLSASAADAAGGYIWTGPASLCQPAKADTGHINYSGSSLFNESTSATATVYCALPYEYYAFQSSTSTPTFEIGYVDPNTKSSTRVSCTVLVTDPFGQVVYSSTSTGVSANASSQCMDWSVTQPLLNGYNNLSISCTLPKGPATATRSGIRMVRVFR